MKPIIDFNTIEDVRGDDWKWNIELVGDADAPLDLTGYSISDAKLSWAGGSLPLTTDNGRIEITPLEGKIAIRIARADSVVVPFTKEVRLIIPLYDPDGNKSTVMIAVVKIISAEGSTL